MVAPMTNEIHLSKAELEIATTCSDKPAQDYSATSSFCDIDAEPLIKDINFQIGRIHSMVANPSCIYISKNYFYPIMQLAMRSSFILVNIDLSLTQETRLFGLRVYIVNEPNHIGVGI